MENEKINLQQLAKVLAQKKGLSQRKAEAFLREFFDAIIQNVTTDKLVKIKGLGTFKLIEVLERESVDVSTGERIIIAGHSKLSFTPDTSLKDCVNKPFADFQTVVINEGTSLEEMERMSSDFPEEEEIEAESIPEPDPEPVPEPESENEPGSEAESTPEPAPEPLVQQAQPASPAPAKVRALTGAEKWALTMGVILLCILSYFLGYYHVFDSISFTPQKKAVKQEVKKPVPTPKVAPAPKPVPTPKAVPAETPVAKKDSMPQVLSPEKKYQITGTRKTHTMKPGDYLTRIAVQEYGDKFFARYIIKYNRFPDPDNIPVGKEILLPELEEVSENP